MWRKGPPAGLQKNTVTNSNLLREVNNGKRPYFKFVVILASISRNRNRANLHLKLSIRNLFPNFHLQHSTLSIVLNTLSSTLFCCIHIDWKTCISAMLKQTTRSNASFTINRERRSDIIYRLLILYSCLVCYRHHASRNITIYTPGCLCR